MEEYECAMCGGIFEKTWTDEEALKESKEYFGEIPIEEQVIICDDCYNKIHPKKFPLKTKIVNALIKVQAEKEC